MHRVLVASLLLVPLLLVPTAAASDGPDEIQECIGSGHWTTLASRALGCSVACVGSGHWTTLPSRVITCAT